MDDNKLDLGDQDCAIIFREGGDIEVVLPDPERIDPDNDAEASMGAMLCVAFATRLEKDLEWTQELFDYLLSDLETMIDEKTGEEE